MADLLVATINPTQVNDLSGYIQIELDLQLIRIDNDPMDIPADQKLGCRDLA